MMLTLKASNTISIQKQTQEKIRQQNLQRLPTHSTQRVGPPASHSQLLQRSFCAIIDPRHQRTCSATT
jgi:hypothetical protein